MDLLELASKIERVLVTNTMGNHFYRLCGRVKQLAGASHPELSLVIQDRQTGVPLEKCRKMGITQPRHRSEVRHAYSLGDVAPQVVNRPLNRVARPPSTSSV